MTGQSFIDPFSAAHLAAIIAAGKVDNPMEAVAQGQEMFHKQNRLRAMGEAGNLYASGDKQGAINRLLSGGALEPEQLLNYEIQQERAKREAASTEYQHSRDIISDQQTAIQNQRAQEALDLQRENLFGPDYSVWQEQRRTGQIPPTMGFAQFKQTLEGGYVDPQQAIDAITSIRGGSAGPRAQGPQGGAGAVAGFPAPGPGQAAVGAGAPPQGPQPAPVQQGPMADLPQVEGITAPTPAPNATSPAPPNQLPMVVNPQAATGQDIGGFDPGQLSRAEGVARTGLPGSGAAAMKILQENPREQNVPPQQRMEQDIRTHWEELNKPFQAQAQGYTTFVTAYDQFKLAEKEGSELGPSTTGMVYSFIRGMDPLGAVQKSDAEMASAAASFEAQVKNLYPNWTLGQKIPTTVVEQMKNLLDAQYGTAFKNYQLREKQRRDAADQIGANPYRAVPDLTSGIRPPRGERRNATDSGARVPTDAPAPGYPSGKVKKGGSIFDWFFEPGGQ
jgi:hypothetical protein